jgi:hypothetical protein
MMAAFFVPGIGFLVAAAAVAAVHAANGWAPAHWLALHRALVGGIAQLVLGAGQFFAGAFLVLTETFHEHEPVQFTPCVERTTLSCAHRPR